MLFNIQHVEGQNLIGFRGFYQRATVSCDSIKMKRNITTISGVGGGIVYKHFELGPIGFQGELNYEEKGFKINNTDTTYYSQKMKYLSVPLMMHVDIGKNAVKAIFALGIYGDYLLEKPSISTNCNGNYVGIERIVNGTCNKFTFGLIGQAGIAVCSKIGVFQLEIRASQGMSKTMNLGDLALLNYLMSRTVGVSFAYMKPFGEKKYYEKRRKPIDDQPININPALEKTDNTNNKEQETTKPEENLTNPESDFDFEEPDTNTETTPTQNEQSVKNTLQEQQTSENQNTQEQEKVSGNKNKSKKKK